MALDLGVSNLGYAFNVEDKVWAGALHLGRGSGRKASDTRAERREHPGLRFVRFADWLDAIPKEMPLDAVVMEAPFLGGFYASFELAGLKAYVREFCCRRDLPPPRELFATSLKKFTTGYGRASKEDMMKAVKEKWGWEAASDDEADAIALLNWGIANL